MFETTKARDQVSELAKTRPDEALKLARTIADPWFAAQALAWVARFGTGDVGATALAEARETAKAGREAYQKCAGLAWPMRAAIETGQVSAAKSMVGDVVVLLPKVKAAPSRAEAGGLLVEAVFPGGRSLWEPMLTAVETHAQPGNDWKAQRTYRSLAQIVFAEDADIARRLVEAIPAGKTRERAEKELAEGVTQSARAFFW